MSKYFCLHGSYLAALLTAIIILSGCSETKQCATKLPEEFTSTKAELAAVAEWNNHSFVKIVNAAFTGNPVAAYVAGMAYLLGFGGAIDTNMANYFFALGARLGFPPALHNIQFMYLEDLEGGSNPFVAGVYLNLTIAYGHKEEISKYEKFKDFLRENLGHEKGNRIICEIERIAIHKHALIEKNKKKQKTAKKDEIFVIYSKSITDEDLLFDNDYWEKVCKREAPENLKEWLNENYPLQLERVCKKVALDKKRMDTYCEQEPESCSEKLQ